MKQTESRWLVQIINKKTGEVVKSLGPMASTKADRVQRGMEINLNREDFRVTQKLAP